MQPLSLFDGPVLKNLIGVFTDIDNMLTTDGAITPDALQALAALKAVGLHVIPITGRPIGWSEPFARGDTARGLAPWPVDAIVAENGAVAFRGVNLQEITTVRLKVEQNQLVTDGWGFSLGSIGLQGA